MIDIGRWTLDNNVILAPMAGVTDLPFRKICKKLGVGMVVGEMVSSDLSLMNTSKSQYRKIHLEEPEPRSIQIVGWDPKMMADAAKFNVDQGASIIDINMGCPAKKVCNKLAGSALLSDEKQVRKILESVVAAVNVPVTLKIRTGIDPSQKNGVVISKIAQETGISMLTVHGRTRQCKFKGKAEYETIRDIKREVSIPVIANGDLGNYEMVKKVLSFTQADGVMIGRNAHGAPWYPGQLAQYLVSGKGPTEISVHEKSEIILEHLDSIYSFYGNFRGVRIARKHIKWYVQNIYDDRMFLAAVNKVESAKEQLEQMSGYLLKIGEQLRAA